MSGLPDLAGKVAVVTGGASGIGKGIATRLVAEGAQVIIADIQRDAMEATAAEIGAAGVPDRRERPGRASTPWPAPSLDRYGAVHVVCNNAGIGPLAPVADLTLDDWRWMIGVNLWGVIHGVHTFLPVLKQNREGGHIVNTASMAGLVAGPRLGAYAAAKYGVVGLTEVLAAELAADNSRVGVSVLCPGTVHTNIGTSSRNRPADLPDAGFKDVDIELEDNPRYRWIYPEEAGAVVVRAIKRGDLYALTHPDWYPMVAERHEAIAEAFREQARRASMRGLDAAGLTDGRPAAAEATVDARHDRLLRPAAAPRAGRPARLHRAAADRQAGDRLEHARGRRRVLPRPRGLHAGRPRPPRSATSTTADEVAGRYVAEARELVRVAHRLRGDRAAQQPGGAGQRPGGPAARGDHVHRGLRARGLQRRRPPSRHAAHATSRRPRPPPGCASRFSRLQRVADVLRAAAGRAARAVRRPRSVAPQDKQYCEITMKTATGDLLTWENIAYYHNQAHRWWYCPDMTRDEAYVFRSFDSAPGHAEQVPHSAFVSESCPASAPPRASIEVRVFAFFED